MAKLIAVTGKGGVGKTTLAALIVRHLRQAGEGPILALDADPDSNLATVLGIEVETTIGQLREEVLQDIKNLPPGMSKQQYIEAGLHQLIVESPQVDLIAMGHGEGPGCYCFVNHVLRKFADDLTPSYRWVVMDNEAGLEHLSRRTASRIDHLLVVVNENPLSIDCARRIEQILDELGREIGSRHYVLNAVRPHRAEEVRARLADTSFACAGEIPRDEALDEAIYRGEPVFRLDGTPAVGAVAEILQTIGAC